MTTTAAPAPSGSPAAVAAGRGPTDAAWAKIEHVLNGLGRTQPDLYPTYFQNVSRTCWAPAATGASGAAAPRLKPVQATLKAIAQSVCMWLSQVAVPNPYALLPPATTGGAGAATAATSSAGDAKDALQTPSPQSSPSHAQSQSPIADDGLWHFTSELERAGYAVETRALVQLLVELVRLVLAACESDARRERLQLHVCGVTLELLGAPPATPHTIQAATALALAAGPSPALSWLFTDIAFAAYTSPVPASPSTSPAPAPAVAADSKTPAPPVLARSSSLGSTSSGSIYSADYRRFVERVLTRACQMLATDNRLSVDVLCRTFERLSGWPCNPVISEWLMQMIAAIKRVRRYGLLWNVTRAIVPSLALQMIPSPAALGSASPAASGATGAGSVPAVPLRRCWSSFRVVEHALMGFQAEPDAFHETVAVWVALLDALTASLPPIAGAAISTTATAATVNRLATPVSPALQDRARYLLRAAQLVQCLMHAHPGYAAVYAPLLTRQKAAERVLSAPAYAALVLTLNLQHHATHYANASAPAAAAIVGTPASSPAISAQPTPVVVTTPAAAAAAPASFYLSDSEMEARLLAHKWVVSGKQSYPFVDGHWQSTYFSDLYLHVDEELVAKQLHGTCHAGPNGASPAPNARLDGVAYLPADEDEYQFAGTYRNGDDNRKPQNTVVNARFDAQLRSFDGTINYVDTDVKALAGVRVGLYTADQFAYNSDFRGASQHTVYNADGTVVTPKAQAAAVASGGADAKANAALHTEWPKTPAEKELEAKSLRNVVTGLWTELDAPTVPTERSTGAYAVVNGSLYMFGGHCNAAHHSNELGFVDVATLRYTPVNAAPGRHPPRVVAPSMVAVGRSLYVFGGQTHTGAHMADLWRFDLDTSAWVQLPGTVTATPLPVSAPAQSVSGAAAERALLKTALETAAAAPLWPEPRSYHAMAHSGAAGDDRIFVFGGVRSMQRAPGDLSAQRTIGSFFNELWVYSIRTHRWAKLGPAHAGAAVPRRRSSHTMVFAMNALWVFGGQDARCHLFDDLWRFSLDDCKWTKIEPAGGGGADVRPQGRQYHAMIYAPLHACLFLYGGSVRASDGAYRNNDFWKFCLRTYTWNRVAALSGIPPPRSHHALGACFHRNAQGERTAETILLYGGTSGTSESTVRHDLWRFQFFAVSADAPPLVANPTPAKFIELLHFDGCSGYVDLQGAATFSFPAAQPYTMECYLLVTERRMQGVLTKFNKLKAGEFAMNVTESLGFQGFREIEPWNHIGKPLQPNIFHHVATVYDGHTLHMFVDGRAYGQVVMGAIAPNPVDVRVFLGASQHDSQPNWHFNGVIMEMRVWAGARTLPQLVAQRKHALTANEDKLVGYWPLLARPECVRDAIGAGTLDRALKMAHHGLRVKGARWVKYPLDLMPTHLSLKPWSASFTFAGSATFTPQNRLMLVDNPKEMSGCTSAVWFHREVQVRRGFECSVTARSPQKSLPEWGGFSIVVQNRHAFAPLHGATHSANDLGLVGVANALAASIVFVKPAGAAAGSPAQAFRVELRTVDAAGKYTTVKAMEYEYLAKSYKLHLIYDGQTVTLFVNEEEVLRAPVDLSAALGLTSRHAWLGVVASQPGQLLVDSWSYVNNPQPLVLRLAQFVGLDEPLCDRVLERCRENIDVAVLVLKDLKATATAAQAAAVAAANQRSGTAAAAATARPAVAASLTAAATAAGAAAYAASLAALAITDKANAAALGVAPYVAPCTSLFDGRWDTNALGRFTLHTVDSYLHAYRVRGTYAAGNGLLRGILVRSNSACATASTSPVLHGSGLVPHPSAVKDWRDAGGWTLLGQFRAADTYNGWRAVRLDFDCHFQALRGTWSNGSDAGTITGQRVDGSPTTLTLKKGFYNLGNTCYMNSFLQAMYMTVGLRHELLRLPCALDYGRADAAWLARLRADGKDLPKPILPLLMPPGPHGACAPSPATTIQRLQRLYMNLLLAQRSAVWPNDFQACLPEPWRGPNQQDSGEFGLFMLDQLESGLKAAGSELDYEAMFNGVVANCVECSDCHKLSRKDETFKMLQLPFPNQYRPITGLMVSRAEDALPPGYHKIHVDVNINQPRNKAYREKIQLSTTGAGAAGDGLAKPALTSSASGVAHGAPGGSSGGGSSGGSSSGGGSSGGGSSGGGSGSGSAKSDDPMSDEKDQKKAAVAAKERKQRESALYLCHSRDRTRPPITDVKIMFVYRERKVQPAAAAAAAAAAAPAAAAKPADAKAGASPAPGPAPATAMDVDDADAIEAREIEEARLQSLGISKADASKPVATAATDKAATPTAGPVAATAATITAKPATDAKAAAALPAVQDKGRILVLIVPSIERGVIPKEVYANIPAGYELIPVNLNSPTTAAAAKADAQGDAAASAAAGAGADADDDTAESCYLLFSRSEQCGSPVTAIDITAIHDPTPQKAGIEKQKMYPNPFCPYPPPVPPPPPSHDGDKPWKPPAQGPPLSLSLSFTGCPIVDLALVSGDSADVRAPPGYRKLPGDFRLSHAGYQPIDAKAPFTFLCYKRGLGHPVTAIEIAKTPERVEQLRADRYEVLVPPLVRGTEPAPAICFRRGDGCPLTSIVVHRGHNEPPAYGDSQLLYVYQEPLPIAPIPPAGAVPAPPAAAASAAAAAGAAAAAPLAPPEPTHPQVAARWSVTMAGTSQNMQFEPLAPVRGRRVTGKYDSNDGQVNGVLWRLDAASALSVGIAPPEKPDAKSAAGAAGAAGGAAVAPVQGSAANPSASLGCWAFEGTFQQTNYKRAGYCAFRWDRDTGSFEGVWSYAEGEGGSWNGFRMSDEAPATPKFRLYTNDRRPVFALADGRLSCLESVAHPPDWEHFSYTVVSGGPHDGGGPEVAFLTTAHGKFVTADETGVVTAKETARANDDASTWYVETADGGVRSFRSLYGNILCFNADGSVVARADRADGDECTRFRLVAVPPPPKDGSEKVSGVWETSNGKLELHVHSGEVVATRVRAVIGEKGLVAADAKAAAVLGGPLREEPGSHIVEGLVLHEHKLGFVLEGKWRRGGEQFARYVKLQFEPLNKLERLKGWLFVGDGYLNVSGRPDNYVCLATLKDYNEQWLAGRQVASSMAETEDLDSMCKQFLNRQVMDDKNRYRCTQCGVLRRAERFTRIVRAPSHLRVTFNRFSYDFRTNMKSKIFQEIDFPVTFSLPVSDLSGAGDAALSVNAPTTGYQYGLYAVIIHSGASADVGHYYCYARESDAPDLTVPESASARWYRFDDHTITVSSFHEIQEVTNRSPQDSAYILWYRLTAVPATSPAAVAAAAAAAKPAAAAAATTAATAAAADSKSAPASPSGSGAAAAAGGLIPVSSVPSHKHSDAQRVPRTSWQLTGSVPQAVYNDNRSYLTTELELNGGMNSQAPAVDFAWTHALRAAWAHFEAADDDLVAAAAAAAADRKKRDALLAATDAKATAASSGGSAGAAAATATAAAGTASSYLSEVRDSDLLPLLVRDPQAAASAAYQTAAIVADADRKAKSGDAKAGASPAASPQVASQQSSPSHGAAKASVVDGVACPNGCGSAVARVALAAHVQRDCPHTLVPCRACAKAVRRSGTCDCAYRDVAVVSCLYCHGRVAAGEQPAHEQRCSAGFDAHLKANEQRRANQAALEESARKAKEEKEAAAAAAKQKEKERAEAAQKAKEARELAAKTGKSPTPSTHPSNAGQPPNRPVAHAPAPAPAPVHECPLCRATFASIDKLTRHVDECIP